MAHGFDYLRFDLEFLNIDLSLHTFGILAYVIEVKGISKSYGTTKAVDDVSFRVEKGEVVGLLGPNGAGKTTILNLITGVMFPDRGQIYVNDALMEQNELAIKNQIGYLAEDNPLYSNLLVSESLRLAGDLKGLSELEYQDNLKRTVKSTGIGEIFYRPIESLSKGLKQRVGLAQALITNPSILIMDEPTEGLDPNQRQEIRKLIRDLGKEHTVLLSSHVMQEVEAICERVIILNKGKVVVSGTRDEITRQTSGPAELLEIECAFDGENSSRMLEKVKQSFAVEKMSDGKIIVRVEETKETDFYRLIGAQTSGEVYVTHLLKKKVGLEEVFRRLTTEE